MASVLVEELVAKACLMVWTKEFTCLSLQRRGTGAGVCVLTGMSAGEGAWVLWKSSYALLVAELFPTLEHRVLVSCALLHSVICSLPPSPNVSFHKTLTFSYPVLQDRQVLCKHLVNE